MFVVVAAAALAGDDHVLENIAPTFIWVVFWVGLVPFVVLFGNVWAYLSPFRAIADAVAWTAERLGVHWRPEPYPERLGRWPAAVLLLLFVSMELVYENPSDPRALALAIYLYAAITWLGMFVFGREAWLQGGEAFNVYFGLLGRIAPFGLVDGRIVLRVPLSGLTRLDVLPGTLAFISVMLGSVGFDSVSRTSSGWICRYDWAASSSGRSSRSPGSSVRSSPSRSPISRRSPLRARSPVTKAISPGRSSAASCRSRSST